MNYITITLTCEKCGKKRTAEFHKSNLTKREGHTHEMITVCHTCAIALSNGGK